MDFETLLNENEKMFNSWKADKRFTERFSEIELQKEFIECIAITLKMKIIIQTPTEQQKDRDDFHSSMEGTLDWEH